MSAIPLFLPMPLFAGQKTQVESISEKMSNENTQQLLRYFIIALYIYSTALIRNRM